MEMPSASGGKRAISKIPKMKENERERGLSVHVMNAFPFRPATNTRFSKLAASLLLLSASPLLAAEKDGLLVDISKRIVARNDHATPQGVGNMEVDRLMSLKLDVTNKSMKDLPAGKAEYIVLIQQWGYDEKHSYRRYEGSHNLEAIRAANSTSAFLGEFRISGHMHGTSDRHVDQFAAWKVIITKGDKKVEFVSTSRFDALNKIATMDSSHSR